MSLCQNDRINFSVIRSNIKKLVLLKLCFDSFDYECLLTNSRNLNGFSTDPMRFAWVRIYCICLGVFSNTVLLSFFFNLFLPIMT